MAGYWFIIWSIVGAIAFPWVAIKTEEQPFKSWFGFWFLVFIGAWAGFILTVMYGMIFDKL